ncbi:MAG: toxin-antitoxin system, toxin component [Bacteroidales bacterium]|nr:toxin-antitoxin system, toxin component [Bacteroidales bacterium]
MSEKEIEDIIDKAKFIVSGYAFLAKEDNVSIVNLNPPHHAALIRPNGEVLETNMYDIELEIVLNKYWAKNKPFFFDLTYA